MRALKVFFLALLILAVLGGAGFGVLAWRQAVDARSLDKVIVEPAPPQAEAPQEPVLVDPRLQGLRARPDGARLLWAPAAGERIAAAGFADDGALILSASSTDGTSARWRVLRLEIASGTPETIFDSKEPRIVSGDRSVQSAVGRLCYSKPNAAGVFDVWCSDTHGRDEKQLTGHDGKEDLLSPSISPDGKWVAFEVNGDRSFKPKRSAAGKTAASELSHGASSIWKIGMDGADIQQLTRGADDRHPSWSSDGRKIHFQRRLTDGNWDIYAMQADGTDPAPILRTADIDELFPVYRGAGDGFLLSELSGSGTPRLKLLDAVTKSGEDLTSGLVPETRPSVSPDGKIASFLAPVDAAKPDDLALWLLPLGG